MLFIVLHCLFLSCGQSLFSTFAKTVKWAQRHPEAWNGKTELVVLGHGKHEARPKYSLLSVGCRRHTTAGCIVLCLNSWKNIFEREHRPPIKASSESKAIKPSCTSSWERKRWATLQSFRAINLKCPLHLVHLIKCLRDSNGPTRKVFQRITPKWISFKNAFLLPSGGAAMQNLKRQMYHESYPKRLMSRSPTMMKIRVEDWRPFLGMGSCDQPANPWCGHAWGCSLSRVDWLHWATSIWIPSCKSP